MLCIRLVLYLFLSVMLYGCVPTTPQNQVNKAQQADVHYKLGVSHLQSNNPTLALKELLVAVENGPENSVIHVALAQAYQQKKAYTEAERHYLRALELSDGDPRYENNLASLYLDMKQWDKAIDYFGRASGNLLFANAHVALTGKGFAYLQKKDFSSALQQFDEVIAIAPRFPQAHYLKAETHQELGELDLAVSSLERATEVAPEFAPAHYQLGVLLLKQQQNDAAKERFERVVELSPTSELGRNAAKVLKTLSVSKAAEEAGS